MKIKQLMQLPGAGLHTQKSTSQERNYPLANTTYSTLYQWIEGTEGRGERMEYTDYESRRLANIMAEDPKSAAAEMRDQLSQLSKSEAIDLIRATKDRVIPGGAGDLMIQAEIDQNGCDTGFRNVTMATPDGPEQIAEIQTQPPSCRPDSAYGDNRYRDGRPPIDPFAAITGLIIGGILSHQRYDHYRSGNSYEERMFMERQLRRENGWLSGRGDFQRQWQDPSWRQQQQVQPYFWGQPGQIMPHHGNHGRGRDMIPGLPFDPRQFIPGLTGRGDDRRYDQRFDPRHDQRIDPRLDPRMDPRNMPRDRDPRLDPRMDPRNMPRDRDPRMDPRLDPRNMPRDRDPRQQHPRIEQPRIEQPRTGQPRINPGVIPRAHDPRLDIRPNNQQRDNRFNQRIDRQPEPQRVAPPVARPVERPPTVQQPPMQRPERHFAPPAQPPNPHQQRGQERHVPPQVDPRLQQFKK